MQKLDADVVLGSIFIAMAHLACPDHAVNTNLDWRGRSERLLVDDAGARSRPIHATCVCVGYPPTLVAPRYFNGLIILHEVRGWDRHSVKSCRNFTAPERTFRMSISLFYLHRHD